MNTKDKRSLNKSIKFKRKLLDEAMRMKRFGETHYGFLTIDEYINQTVNRLDALVEIRGTKWKHY